MVTKEPTIAAINRWQLAIIKDLRRTGCKCRIPQLHFTTHEPSDTSVVQCANCGTAIKYEHARYLQGEKS